ncbi:MAG: hypothetical protein ABI629_24485 [bacterium]
MHPRARRAISSALSIALHVLLLLWVMGTTITESRPSEQDALPVRIIDEPRPMAAQKAAPKVAKPVEKPPEKPPEEVAKLEPPAEKPPDVPAPEPPPPAPQPEKKLPLPEQIVQPPDQAKEEAPQDTRFKSDRDASVEKQQVKRGNPKPGESAPGEAATDKPAKPKPPAPPPAPKPVVQQKGSGGRQLRPQVATLPNLDRLMPNALKLAQEGYGQPVDPPPAERPDRQLARGGNDGLFIPTGPTGTLDYLPDIREGDITLLNTKADVFAPFVRRVAVRVFQNLLISLKRDLANTNISTQESIEAEAVMSPRGEMLGFTVTKRSPRVALGLDRRMLQACNVAFFDRNPPPGARSADGNIHFQFVTTFEAQSTPRGLAYAVMLGTGLL